MAVNVIAESIQPGFAPLVKAMLTLGFRFGITVIVIGVDMVVSLITQASVATSIPYTISPLLSESVMYVGPIAPGTLTPFTYQYITEPRPASVTIALNVLVSREQMGLNKAEMDNIAVRES